ncbi:helix-turn-helix domain-containing protein [Desulfopila aestuarii]|nr:helix-turn-helix domain-containing protein [Desulfopila aestuarii]
MMTQNEIRAAMMIKGVKVNDIARKLNLANSNIIVVIHGHRPNQKVRKGIADAICKSVSDIWPELAEGRKK